MQLSQPDFFLPKVLVNRRCGNRTSSFLTRTFCAQFRRGGIGMCMFFILGILSGSGAAQTSLPFEVKNPKHKKWPEAQALKIYTSACELAARAIRPEQPPHLHPNFVLILGSTDNETVRARDMSEIRLKDWM